MARIDLRAAALLVVAIAAVALSAVAATGSLLPGDAPLARALQDTPGGRLLDPLADWLALSAVEYAVLFVAMLVAFARRDRALGTAALLALAATALNPALKDLIGRARPTAADVTIREPAPGLGFPSGHTMSATLLYGYAVAVACLRLPRAATVLAATPCACAIAIIGWERVYSGAHWPSDVAGGFTIGVLLLAATIALPHAAAAAVRSARRTHPP